jgi:predicted nucleic acid-binding protein
MRSGVTLSLPTFTIIPVTDEEVEAAADLLRAHPEYAIGAADAIHLATALALTAQGQSGTPLVFVTADKGLAAAARQHGLTVFNPLYQQAEELKTITGTDG